MGKTAVSMVIAGDVAINQNLPVAVFSMKHDKATYAQRLLKTLIEYRQTNEKSADFIERKSEIIDEIKRKLKSAHIYVDDTPSLNIKSLVNHCQTLSLSCGQLGVVIVDNFEMMSPDINQSNQSIYANDVSKELWKLAKEINCPVLITTTLSRRLEHREFKQPILSDLKHGGALGKYADRLLFLYRPQAYEYDSQEPLKIIDGKSRNKSLSVEIDDFITIQYRR